LQAVDRSRLDQLLSTKQIEPARNYGKQTPIGWLTGYVGYLDVKTTSGASLKCTGTLISADLVLTNVHCIGVSWPDRAVSVEFTLGYISLHTNAGQRVFKANHKPVERGAPHGLDYAIVRLKSRVRGFVIRSSWSVTRNDPSI